MKKQRKPRPTKAEIADAKLALEHAARLMRIQDETIDDEWKAQPNPFVAARWYCSAQQRERRAPIIESWKQARDAYEAVRSTSDD